MPNRLENQMSQKYSFKFLSERKSSKMARKLLLIFMNRYT